jgi:hypothetical protein
LTNEWSPQFLSLAASYTNMAAISLFWYTNMAAVTSDENDLLGGMTWYGVPWHSMVE